MNTRCLGNGRRFLRGFDAAPFVCRLGVLCVSVGEPIFAGRPVFGVTSSPDLGYLEKAERHRLADGRRNRVMMDAVALKIGVGDGKFSVLIAADGTFASMLRKLDFHPKARRPSAR